MCNLFCVLLFSNNTKCYASETWSQIMVWISIKWIYQNEEEKYV